MAYQKPLVLRLGDLAEGVYAGSGDEVVQDAENQSSVSYSLSVTGAWENNINYNITLTNNSDEKVDNVSVKLKVNGTVTTIEGGVSGTISGNTATVTCNNYGNGIGPNATVVCYMHVEGVGEFSLE